MNDERKMLKDSNPSMEAIEGFFIIAVQTLGSGISILLAVGTSSTGSGKLYCKWELSSSSGNALCILFPTNFSFFIIAVQTLGSGISILLAVGTPSTGSGNLYCQWELSPSSGNTLCILFTTVGKFHFPTDFVVVYFDADPRVPLILGRSFLKTGRALIDVYAGELTLRVNNEAVTLNLDQTSRYSTNYNDMMANRIDVIDMAYDEYSQEVLGFSDVIVSGNPTSYYDPIVSTSSSTLTPFGDSDFLLEEVDALLAFEDDPTSSEVDHSYYDTEGDILLLEAFVNDDPSLPPPNQGMYLP
nr:reverse transcriptase domain-containing protein [Tanacetum cinerariifolium]